MEKRSYKSALKFRCILRLIYDPPYGYSRKREPHIDAGLTDEEIVEEIGLPPPALADAEAIARTVDYTFDFDRGRFAPGRFNTERFPALYTAKEPRTAEKERRHHWPALGGEDPAFVVFSIRYTGTALDIRKDIAAGVLPFPEEFEGCQPYAEEALAKRCNGLAAPSKRDPGGSCCAIFDRRGIEANAMEMYGEFS